MVNKENIICVESVKTKEFHAVLIICREFGLNNTDYKCLDM